MSFWYVMMDADYFLRIGTTILFGIFLGAVSTIPVGAVQLQVIRKSMNGHRRAALLTALGSVTSDFIYGILTLYGFSRLLMMKKLQLAVYSLGIIVLSFIIIKMFRERHQLVHQDMHVKYHGRISFISGFTIAITNPGMVIWWIFGFRIFLDLGLFTEADAVVRAIFILSGCLGLGGYLTGMAFFISRVKKSFSDKFLFHANIFIIFVLSLILLFFTVKLAGLAFNFPVGRQLVLP